MRTVPSHIQAKLTAGVVELATCWTLTLADKTVLRYTDHHDDITIGANTWQAGGNFSRTAITYSLGLSPDNLEVQGALGGGAITAEDILAGLYDDASVYMFLVDYTAPNSGVFDLCDGRLGQVRQGDGQFTAVLQGLASLLGQRQSEMTSPTCRANFGDLRCKVNPVAHTYTGTLVADSAGQWSVSTSLGLAAGLLNYGLLTFTSGDNDDWSVDIKSHGAGGVITFCLPAPRAMRSGDAFVVTRGCAKTRAACKAYGNIANFRGEPDLPGTDTVLKIADVKPSGERL